MIFNSLVIHFDKATFTLGKIHITWDLIFKQLKPS